MREEIRVVFDAYIFKGSITGIEPGYKTYGTMLKRHHALVISGPLMEKYCKAIADNNYSPSAVYIKITELERLGKVRSADKKLRKRIEVKVETPEKDKPFAEAAIALGAKYLVTQDQKHFLSKKEEFLKEHQVKVLRPEEYCA